MGDPLLVLHTDRDQPVDAADQEAFARLGADLVFVHSTGEFEKLAPRAIGVLNTNFLLTDGLIGRLDQCRVIARYGSGYDNIDIAAATRKGIPVAYVPVFCVEEVANRALTLLLACAANLVTLDRLARSGVWGVNHLPFTAQIEGCVLGLVGFGKIGRAVARRAKAFGLDVKAYDPQVSREAMEAEGIGRRTLDELLAESDFVSLHAPLSAGTRHLMNAERLGRMKPTAYLINTSRGGLVEEAALLASLRQQSIAGAGLDVFEKEPPGKDNPLLLQENVVVTPHCAAHTALAHEKVRRSTVDAVLRALRGERPVNVVNPDVWARAGAAV